MDCKQTEKLIPEFLKNDMDYRTMRDFMDHIDSCTDCKEELTIQFLVEEGVQALETGDAFDLSESVEDCLSKARQHIKVNRRLTWLRNIFFLIVVAALIAAGIIAYRFYFG